MSNALWNMAYAHLQAENATLKAKVESLEARATELAQELDDWRNREAACCPEDTPFEDEIKALRAKVESLEAKLRALEGAAREVLDCPLFVEPGTNPKICTMSVGLARIGRLRLMAGHPTKGEEAPALGVVEALRFYADEDNYYGKYNGEKKRLPAITEDMGEFARQALAALQNQQEKK